MKETWQVAELLEEIAKKADPAGLMMERMRKIGANVAASPLPHMKISPDEVNNRVEVTFYYPVGMCMQGVSGTIEEVLEWLKTSQHDGCSKFELVNMNGPAFAVTQIHEGPTVVEDYSALVMGYMVTMHRSDTRRAEGAGQLPPEDKRD